MAQSQSADEPEPTTDQTELIDALSEHLSRVHFNERTGKVIGGLKPTDNYHGAYRVADELGFSVSVFNSNEYSLSLSFKE